MKRTHQFLFCVALPLVAISIAGSEKVGFESTAFAGQGGVEFAASSDAAGYLAVQDLRLNAISDNPEIDRKVVELAAGTELVLLEKKEDAVLGSLVRVGVDAGEESGVPSDFWIKEEEMHGGNLLALNDGEMSILKKMTYCYRYVKQYLLKTGQVKVYLPGESAYMAAKILPKHGFRNSGHSPSSAKNGEVCVYSGGPKGHGHIEVKRNGKWWYGYGFLDNPIRNRKFIACFVK